MFPSNPLIPRPGGQPTNAIDTFRRMLESLSTKNASMIVNLAKFMAKNPVKNIPVGRGENSEISSANASLTTSLRFLKFSGISLDRQELSRTTARS